MGRSLRNGPTLLARRGLADFELALFEAAASGSDERHEERTAASANDIIEPSIE